MLTEVLLTAYNCGRKGISETKFLKLIRRYSAETEIKGSKVGTESKPPTTSITSGDNL